MDPGGNGATRSVTRSLTELQANQAELAQVLKHRATFQPLGEPCFVHNDYWPGNVLSRGGRLIAVIDWEDAGFGDPMVDVAYCESDMRYAGLDDAADRFIAKYVEKSGRDLVSLELWAVMALARPLPDIARWLESWQMMGQPGMRAGVLRSRHTRLIEMALGDG